MAAKMFALFALLALCATATSATHIQALVTTTDAIGYHEPWMQYCMKQQGVANLLAWPTLMLQQLLASPLQQCQMPMMMPGMMPPMTMMPMPSMMPSMVPTMMSPMTMASMMPPMMMPSMISPMTMPSMMPSMIMPTMMSPMIMPSMMPPMMMPSMVSPMMMPNMMTVPQCYSGSISHIIQQQQLPFMFSPTAMAIPPMFLQQPFVGAAF
uniref:DZS18 n=1 Tax=Zea mays TaxID=4577 RepID=Q41756_MAIZE|nr:DZS18 [Zea mays]